MVMTNRSIMEITTSFIVAKQQSEHNGGIVLPASIAWKRRLNMKELFSVRETIVEAVKEDEKKLDEILKQETDVNIRTIKIDELGDCKVSDVEMDTLAFMIEQD